MSASATAAAAATAAGAVTRAPGARGCSPSSDPLLLHAAGSDVIFRKATSLEALNASSRNTAMEALGIVFTEIGDDYVRGTMPVDARTHQPYGLLHGGASVLLAETLGSSAGNLCVDDDRMCVGIEINANHLAGVREGTVTGTARPLHVGRSTPERSEEHTSELQSLMRISYA